MAVRKPLEKQPPPHQYDIEELLAKGASVKEDNKLTEQKDWAYINLRVPSKMLKGVDVALQDRVGISRTGWILEAIHEKLNKGRGE